MLRVRVRCLPIWRAVAVAAACFAVLLILTGGPLPTPTVTTPIRDVAVSSTCPSGIGAADCAAATYVYQYATSHPFNAPPGYTGGASYGNTTGLLPPSNTYHEYDIYPNGGGRVAQRLVIDWQDPQGSAWFSADHYANFVQFYLLA